jgi:hypothetical protein
VEVTAMTREEFLRQEIEKYERKIETYKAMVGEWKTELGMAGDTGSQFQSADASVKKKAAGSSDPLSMVQGMIFFNKSQTEAAKAFLEMVGYPLKTSVILEAVEKGGITVGGKTPTAKKQNFYTGLHRSSDFALVQKDTWGLTSWPGVTKKASEEVDQDDSSNGTESLRKASAESKSS